MYKNKRTFFRSYEIEGDWDCIDFDIRFDLFLSKILNTTNEEVGLDHLGISVKEDYYPFIKFYYNQKDSFLGKHSIKYQFERMFCDTKSWDSSQFIRSILYSLKMYGISNSYDKVNYNRDFTKYDLRTEFDLEILTYNIYTHIEEIKHQSILRRDYFKKLIKDGVKGLYRTRLGVDMSVLDMIYEMYFILGYDDNNKLVMTKINKPTFQFKQQVKWGVISKSDYNYIMIRMYGRYFY